MPLTNIIPVPSKPNVETNVQDQRLWIGNLDNRVTEYHLLKMLQKYGQIEKFDLLYHRSGPLAGQPRGYAFVSYKSKEDAVKVQETLDGKKIGSKHIAIRWAHSMTKDEMKTNQELFKISALTGAKCEKKISRTTAIQAIEAKLKMMEHNSDTDFELKINPSTSGRSASNKYSYQETLNNKKMSKHRNKTPYRPM